MLDLEYVDIEGLVSLKTAKKLSTDAASQLTLAEPLTYKTTNGYQSLWLGPDQWLLASKQLDSDQLIAMITDKLGEGTYLANDVSHLFKEVCFEGEFARELLASGCALDLRDKAFSTGSCMRTRLAQIPVIVSCSNDRAYKLMFDHSYTDYLDSWLCDSMELIKRTSGIV